MSVDGNDSKADKEDKKERQTATLGLVWWFGKEGRFNLNIRAEFSNIFNRAFWNDPGGGVAGAVSLVNYKTLAARDPSTGVYTAGFGQMPVAASTAVNTAPRGGTIIARITF